MAFPKVALLAGCCLGRAAAAGCSCKATWSNTYCSNQEGCPATACDSWYTSWCEVEPAGCDGSDLSNGVYWMNCDQSTPVSGQTPDGCALYIAGPVVASKGNQVATVDSLQNYELTFTMELASDWSINGDWVSILHIGDTNNQRFPGIWFHYSQNGITPAQSYSDCYPSVCQWYFTSTSAEFTAGETYDIKVVVENNQMTVYVDGVNRGTGSGSSTYTATDVAVYVGDPWYDAAKVTLSDITLSEIALADVCRENIVAAAAGIGSGEDKCLCDQSGATSEVAVAAQFEWHMPNSANVGIVQDTPLDYESRNSYLIVPDFEAAMAPSDAITVAAWVTLDSPTEYYWGGIVSFLQDNGSYERGFVLGYTSDGTFTWAVSDGHFYYLKATTAAAQAGVLHHVVGTYDSTTQKLYVDGELVATETLAGTEASGAIEYAGTETLAFGCYLDDDEEFQMSGTIESVKIFDSALTAQQVRGLEAVPTATTGTDDADHVLCPCEDNDDSNNKGNNSLVLILGVVGALLFIMLCVSIAFVKGNFGSCPCLAKHKKQCAVSEPTAPPMSPGMALAPIKAEIMAEATAVVAAEATNLPPGHVSGAEAAAAMAAGEPPPQPSEGWGRRFASWRAVEEPPPPPEAEFEPEC